MMDEDDRSVLTNDESINTFNSAKGVHINNNGEFNMDMTDKEHEHFLAQSLKKMGNMSCKPIYKYATTDLFKKRYVIDDKKSSHYTKEGIGESYEKTRVNL
jgi:hypothetical protein